MGEFTQNRPLWREFAESERDGRRVKPGPSVGAPKGEKGVGEDE